MTGYHPPRDFVSRAEEARRTEEAAQRRQQAKLRQQEQVGMFAPEDCEFSGPGFSRLERWNTLRA